MRILPFIAVLLISLALPFAAGATHFADVIRGRILLDVETNGEAWYVYPESGERYYLGRPTDAFAIMRFLSLGITDADLERIPVAGSGSTGDTALRERLSGTILLQVEQNGEAWYVYPETLERHYLGRPDDAFAIMRFLSLGITAADLAHVPVAEGSLEPPPPDDTVTYAFTSIGTPNGTFSAHVVTLRRDKVEMATNVAHSGDCDGGCAAMPLADHVAAENGIVGIHGTYFCPPDYSNCAGKEYSFLPPVFDSSSDAMRNEDLLKFHNRPMVVSTAETDLRYFHRSNDFGDTVAEFEASTGETVRAAIGNWPSLVESGVAVAATEPQEPNFKNASSRGGIGWDDQRIFLVVAWSATIEDLADIFVALGADNAMNLDGGGSVALYAEGGYKAGPGRLLPNAIVFRKK